MKLFESDFDCVNFPEYFPSLNRNHSTPKIEKKGAEICVKITSISIYKAFKKDTSFYCYLSVKNDSENDFFKGFATFNQVQVNIQIILIFFPICFLIVFLGHRQLYGAEWAYNASRWVHTLQIRPKNLVASTGKNAWCLVPLRRWKGRFRNFWS